MRSVLVVGIGAGDPRQITIEAIEALNHADVIVVVEKPDELQDLAALRHEICNRYIRGPYREARIRDPERGRGVDAVAAWRDARAGLFAGLIAGLDDDESGAFLVWGDPALYDSTLSVLDEVAGRQDAVPFTREVIPAISSVQALAARHQLVLNRVGRPVTITPGRRLAEVFTADVADVIVLLDTACGFMQFPGADIYWGAYLGTPDELLIAGRVAEVGEEIRRVRAEARERKGWMFDTYLLRRP